MFTPQEARRLFSRIVRLHDEDINLTDAALLIAIEQGSDVNVELCHSHLIAMSNRVQRLLDEQGLSEPAAAPLQTIQTINRVLYEEEGFRGNEDDYYDPGNSCLDHVLAHRTGIPITLSIIYMDIAERIGLPVRGIGLPGHFVVAYWSNSTSHVPSLIVDPFNRGAVLSCDDCAARLQAAYGDDLHLNANWLQPLPHRQILSRMLNNLKQIYLSLDERKKALRAMDMLLLVQPDAVWEYKERGLLYYRMGIFVAALADLRRYLRWAPAGEDTDLLKYYVQLLQRLVVSHN